MLVQTSIPYLSREFTAKLEKNFHTIVNYYRTINAADSTLFHGHQQMKYLCAHPRQNKAVRAITIFNCSRQADLVWRTAWNSQRERTGYDGGRKRFLIHVFIRIIYKIPERNRLAKNCASPKFQQMTVVATSEMIAAGFMLWWRQKTIPAEFYIFALMISFCSAPIWILNGLPTTATSAISLAPLRKKNI